VFILHNKWKGRKKTPEACLPIEFWGECVLGTTYLINRTPTQVLYGKTLYEVLFRAKSSDEHITIFGYLCYAYNVQRKKVQIWTQIRR